MAQREGWRALPTITRRTSGASARCSRRSPPKKRTPGRVGRWRATRRRSKRHPRRLGRRPRRRSRATGAARAAAPCAGHARNRRLIDRRLEDRLVATWAAWNTRCFLDDTTGRWLKITMPGKGGQGTPCAAMESDGLRRAADAGDRGRAALGVPAAAACWRTTRLGDDFWLHGVIAHPAGPRMVVSASGTSAANRPAPAEIARHFVTAGYTQVNAKTFYAAREKNLLVSDAHTANVFRTSVRGSRRSMSACNSRSDVLSAGRSSPRRSLDLRRLGRGATGIGVLRGLRDFLRRTAS